MECHQGFEHCLFAFLDIAATSWCWSSDLSTVTALICRSRYVLWPEATKEKLDAKADLSEVAKAAKLPKSYCPIASNRSAECLDKMFRSLSLFLVAGTRHWLFPRCLCGHPRPPEEFMELQETREKLIEFLARCVANKDGTIKRHKADSAWWTGDGLRKTKDNDDTGDFGVAIFWLSIIMYYQQHDSKVSIAIYVCASGVLSWNCTLAVFISLLAPIVS